MQQRDHSRESYRSNATLERIVPDYYPSSSLEEPPPLIKMLFDRYWFETTIQIDHEDDEGRTPLHIAAMENRYSFVKYLLEKKARLDVRIYPLFYRVIYSFLYFEDSNKNKSKCLSFYVLPK